MLNSPEYIEQANAVTIQNILDAVLKRYAALFPNWDIGIIALQKREDRNEQLDRMIEFLESLKSDL